MKRILPAVVILATMMLTGCSVEDPGKAPLYPNSGLDVSTNVDRYIQPVMQKGQVVVTEGTMMHHGAGSTSVLQNEVSQTQQVIAQAKTEISAMSFPASEASQETQAIQTLTALSVDVNQVLVTVQKGKDPEPAYEQVTSDLDQLQGDVQAFQGLQQ